MVGELDYSLMLLRLKHSLQALAMPASVQVYLETDEVGLVVDDVAIDFDNWHRCVVGHGANRVTDEQRALLAGIDRLLGAMSGAENTELWTEEALSTAPEWATIRELATRALTAFGWEIAAPP